MNNKKPKGLSIKLPEDLYYAVKREALDRRVTVQAMIIEMLKRETKHARDETQGEEIMNHYTQHNTEGYTDEQLTELNRRYDEITREFTEEDWDAERQTKHVSERILCDFDNALE